MEVVLRHLALFSFLASSSLTVSAALFLFRVYSRTEKREYRFFGHSFSWIAGAMAFLYLAEYMVINITHDDTILYAALEAAAFSSFVIALYCMTLGTAAAAGKGGIHITARVLLIVSGIMLIFTRFSNHLFGRHLPFFHYVKITIVGTLGILIVLGSFFLLGTRKDSMFCRILGAMGITLPLFCTADLTLLRFKLYDGPVRLGMSYPLTISGYIVFCLIITFILVRTLKKQKAPDSAVDALMRQYGITKREKEIILLISEGMSNADIADTLCISLTTVKNHVHNIFGKMDITSRYELINLILSPCMEK